MRQTTRTYEGRIPAKAMVEGGVLWIPVDHHIEGVFENHEAHTTITFAQAEGDLAESTLVLTDEYRELQERANQPPTPEEYFALQELPSPPSTVDAPQERGEWQFYWHGRELLASRIPSAKLPRPTFYRLYSRDEQLTLQTALDLFERAVVEHGHLRIRIKDINNKIRENINLLKKELSAIYHRENASEAGR